MNSNTKPLQISLTQAQIEQLAESDLDAALAHPNASFEFLIQHPKKLKLIQANPAWVLISLEKPEAVETFELSARLQLAEEEIKSLCTEAIETEAGKFKLLAWLLNSARSVLWIWDEKYPEDKRPAQALEALEVYLTNPNADNLQALKNAAVAAYDAYTTAAYTASAIYAAYAAPYAAIHWTCEAMAKAKNFDIRAKVEYKEMQLQTLQKALT